MSQGTEPIYRTRGDLSLFSAATTGFKTGRRRICRCQPGQYMPAYRSPAPLNIKYLNYNALYGLRLLSPKEIQRLLSMRMATHQI